MLIWIVGYTFLGGVVSALAASLFLLAPRRQRIALLPHLISFATGALLGAALLGLLPHAVEAAGPDRIHGIGLAVLFGILLFFVLEKLVLWRHCHADECDVHTPTEQHRDAASAKLILFGSGLHNFLDGVLIGAAFLTDIHLGIVTAVAVFAHEVPQEIGDLAILLHGGMSRAKALAYNVLISLTTVMGGLMAYWWLEDAQRYLPYVLAVAASSFLYVAVADLIPGLHRKVDARTSIVQVVLISVGVGVIQISHAFLH